MNQVNGAQAIWQLTTGFFMTARIVQTACTLGVFDRLGDRPASADDLATEMRADRLGMEALLTACAAMGVLERSSTGLYRNGPAAATFLRASANGSLRDTVVDAGRMYAEWVDLPEVVRIPRVATRRTAGEEASKAYLDGVFSTSWPAAIEFAAKHDFTRVREVLDVGGGTGAYSIALCQRWPALRVRLLERPAVVHAARKSVGSAGFAERISVCSGDYLADPFDDTYELVLLMNVLHQEDAADARRLVARAAGALAPAGRLAIQDICLNPQRTGPAMAALLGMNLFLRSGGSVHGVADLSGWLQAAGLEVVQMDQHATTGFTTLIARVPERG